MKNILLFLIFFVLVTSCVTEKKRLKICQSCAIKVEKKDSIIEKITILPYDTTALISRHIGKVSTYTDCDSLLKALAVNNNTITTTKDGVKSVITKHGTGISFHCETDSLKEVIALLRIQKEVKSFHSEIKEVPVCNLDHKTWWDILFIWVGRVSLGAIILFLSWKLYIKKLFLF